MKHTEHRLRGFYVALCLLAILIPHRVTALSTSSTTSSPPSSGIPSSDKDDVCGTEHGQKPNIIIIIADDLGWNDISFHGSNQIPTPNIDALAYNGVILNKYYQPALCTPSRSSLMTGYYPIHLGEQHSVIFPSEPRGLTLSKKLLPQYLREAGYRTHAVGKWHLGFHRSEYKPTYRGFDSHYGYWNGVNDYYSHYVRDPSEKFNHFFGYDMRNNEEVDWSASGKYTTDLLTEEAIHLINTHNTTNPMFLYLAHLAPHSGNADDPLQAPDEEIAKFSYVRDPERRIYAAMVSKLDQSVGDVMAALRNRGMLENSIVIFTSDNGAPTSGILANHGSNYPLRGIKDSPWEGGIRGAAAIWSPMIKKLKRVSNEMFYVTDWLPTLFCAAGLDKKLLPRIDGIDQWPTLTSGNVSPRSEILVNIDDISGYAAIRRGDYKYVIGMTHTGSKWQGQSGRPELEEEEEGTSPLYEPNRVLQSKAGVAIAGVVTARQIAELKERKRHSSEGKVSLANFEDQLLKAEDILRMRQQATIHCNVKIENVIPCDPLEAPCLFNILKDPCEMVNIAEERPVTLSALEQALFKYRLTALPPANRDFDPRSNPALWNNTWTSWLDDKPLLKPLQMRRERPAQTPISVVILTGVTVGLVIVVVLIGIALKCKKHLNEDSNVWRDTNRVNIISSQSNPVQTAQEHDTFRHVPKNVD